MRALPRPRKGIQLDVSLAIVNIVLLLIFFFLATGQLLNPPSEGVELAETTDLPLDQLPQPILVVDASGGWQLDGEPVVPDLLSVALNNMPSPVTLHILISGDAPAGSLLDIVNRADLAQAEMKLVTLRTAGDDE